MGPEHAIAPEEFLRNCTRAFITNRRTAEQMQKGEFWAGTSCKLSGPVAELDLQDFGDVRFDLFWKDWWSQVTDDGSYPNSADGHPSHWRRFKKTTPVGLKGYLIPVSAVHAEGVPKLYWDDCTAL
ncbi:unnamed protein product [Polarella glacialis]|uniref:Uncharacterized protein n=1 Tax=Polarella glacialis TaxID=89957 RepID=A0A813IX27_POLGL|nr:unnamed protein product [Polarella glacialis]